MARPLRVEYAGAFYHITSRGNEKKRIYSTSGDKEKFLTYLGAAHKRFKIIVHSYCLMSNHYHLLLETPIANLSQSMQLINSSYATYYNIKHKRKGHLLQGRYKAILVDTDTYLKTLGRYIHLNPARAKILKRPEEYHWSSYRFYLSTRKHPDFLNTDLTLSYFCNNKKEYKRFTEAGILKRAINPFKMLKEGFILGDEQFVKEIRDKYLLNTKQSGVSPNLKKLEQKYISSDKILSLLNKISGLDNRTHLKFFIYLLRKYTDNTLKNISRNFFDGKISVHAISKIAVRMEQKRQTDKRLNKILSSVEQKCLMSRSDP